MKDLSTSTVSIVGGGIAGLIAAAHLARAGLRVTVFESAGSPGGRARTRAVDGFFLNQGPHALYRDGAFRRELDRLGVPFKGKPLALARPQGLWRGRLHALPATAQSLLMTDLLGVGEKIAYARILKAIVAGATGEGTFADWMDAQGMTPRLRAALEALGRVSSYTHAPEMVSASAMLDQIRLGLNGVLYLDGGWATLVDGLADAARAAGAALNMDARVERVSVEDGVTRIVLADGTQHVSEAAILAVGPKEAAELARDATSLRVEAEEARAIRINALDLALSAWPAGGREFVLGIDQPYYVSLHSRAAKLAPEGGAVVHLARYLAPGEAPKQDAIAELEALADLTMPGWRPLEARRQELRGIVVSHAVARADRPRPGVALRDAPGLFIAGDWVGDEGMIADCAAASAVKAAEAVQRWLAQRGGQTRAA